MNNKKMFKRISASLGILFAALFMLPSLVEAQVYYPMPASGGYAPSSYDGLYHYSSPYLDNYNYSYNYPSYNGSSGNNYASPYNYSSMNGQGAVSQGYQYPMNNTYSYPSGQGTMYQNYQYPMNNSYTNMNYGSGSYYSPGYTIPSGNCPYNCGGNPQNYYSQPQSGYSYGPDNQIIYVQSSAPNQPNVIVNIIRFCRNLFGG